MNKKLGTHNFKQQAYNSSTSQQLLRLGAAHEESSHRKAGRTRLATTGRKTLKRNVPKWQQEANPRPPKGKLLDAKALREILAKAIAYFDERPLFPTGIPRKAMKKAMTKLSSK